MLPAASWNPLIVMPEYEVEAANPAARLSVTVFPLTVISLEVNVTEGVVSFTDPFAVPRVSSKVMTMLVFVARSEAPFAGDMDATEGAVVSLSVPVVKVYESLE